MVYNFSTIENQSTASRKFSFIPQSSRILGLPWSRGGALSPAPACRRVQAMIQPHCQFCVNLKQRADNSAYYRVICATLVLGGINKFSTIYILYPGRRGNPK